LSSSFTSVQASNHPGFRVSWWLVNILLVAATVSAAYTSAREYSVRRYLKGFSDAIVPAVSTPEQKVDAILEWMRSGPPRPLAREVRELNTRDPEVTLNYQQLLQVCGTATNAFLNLSHSSGLTSRRLLLLMPNLQAKHVVAEVLLDNRWIVVDPTFRVVMRSASGRQLTREELRDPSVFAEATRLVPGYPPEYTYEKYAHVRLARLPLEGLGLRKFLGVVLPGWEESAFWSLLLERESFLAMFLSCVAMLASLFLRILLGWYADRRLRVPRFHLRRHVLRAGAAFLSAPEMKQ
jgi:hypothetical protein